MYVQYAIIADSVVPGGSGKLNIIGTFNVVWAKAFPVRHPRLAIVVRVEGHGAEAGDHTFELVFVNADGKVLGGPPAQKFRLDPSSYVPGTPLSFEAILEINGLQIPQEGDYEFAVKVDGAYLDSAPLYVRLARDRPQGA